MAAETGSSGERDVPTRPEPPSRAGAQPTPGSRAQVVALVAAVLIPVVTGVSLLWGVWTYQASANAQVQLLALGALQHYLDLAIAHPEEASRRDDQPVDAKYAWFAAQALTTAQVLRTLVGDQPSWQRSIDAIVRHHRSYLRSGAFQCDDFAPEFVGYLRAKVPELACAGAGGGAAEQ